MLGRGQTPRAQRRTPGGSLPELERLAPAAPMAEIAAQIGAWTRPGDIVLDLNGRGGWVARAALASQRVAADLESSSLTRLLADVVVRPPDPSHLDAAMAAISARPLGQTRVEDAIEEPFATSCPVCGRTTVLESMDWEVAADGSERPTRREFRCQACQRQLGGPALRHGEPTDEDVARTEFALPADVRDGLRKRFPTPSPDDPLPDQLLELHSPRQLFGLAAILEAIESETRPAPVTAALRLAFMHAVDCASRSNQPRGRASGLHIWRGKLKRSDSRTWRERSPWAAFREGAANVRRLLEHLAADPNRPNALRPVTDLADLHQGVSNVVLAEATPGTLRRLAMAGERIAVSTAPSRVRLVLGQVPLRLDADRLALAYRDTAWALGSGAASMLPYQRLFQPPSGAGRKSMPEETARALARSLAVAAATLSRNGHAIVILDDAEPATLVAAALGGAAAGYRLAEARLVRTDGEHPIAVFVPPAGTMAPVPRTRAGRPLPPIAGGAGDPGSIAGQGVFAAPERLDERSFRTSAAASALRDAAVEALKARGEPARFEELLGELLVGLDRSAQLARFAARLRPPNAEAGWNAWIDADGADATATEATPTGDDGADAAPASADLGPASADLGPASADLGPTSAGPAASKPANSPAGPAALSPADAPDPVAELLTLIRGELDRSTNRRVRQIEPGLYWLASDEDRAATAQPLADRVEWATFSLLSSSAGIDREAALDRLATLFAAHGAPDGELLRACLDSYAGPGSTPQAIVMPDRLERRSAEHDAVIASIADLGHRLGARVWIGRRQQQRRVGDHRLAEWLDAEEREIDPAMIAWGPQDELERVDCAWYSRRRAAYLFEVEWTAMLGDAVSSRHSRFPEDDRVVRFLVVPPERADLVRFKLDRSPLLRRAFDERNWHVLRWDRLGAFAALEEVSLAALEPYVGLDAPPAEEQLELPQVRPADEVS